MKKADAKNNHYKRQPHNHSHLYNNSLLQSLVTELPVLRVGSKASASNVDSELLSK